MEGKFDGWGFFFFLILFNKKNINYHEQHLEGDWMISEYILYRYMLAFSLSKKLHLRW